MKTACILALAGTTVLSALEIRIDYSYDTTNFFNTAEKRQAMETVAAFFGDMIQDELLRIDQAEFPGGSWTATFFHPATGSQATLPGLVVPENTIIVYVGARNLSGSVAGTAGPGGYSLGYTGPSSQLWFDRVRGRGSAAAAHSTPSLRTDFAPWGGSIAFDADRTWNFSLNQNLSGTDFVSVALHELGHVLGLGLAPSWDNLISGTGKFTGPAVFRSLGGQPSVTPDAGHFASPLTSPTFGSFSIGHGTTRPVLMLATRVDDGTNLGVASDLDLAALIDCGWEISPQTLLTATALGPMAASFQWKSSSFFDYQVQRGDTLVTFPITSPVTLGNGGIQMWADPSPPATRAFYRLAATPAFSAPAAAAPTATPMAAAAKASTLSFEEAPRMVVTCQCTQH